MHKINVSELAYQDWDRIVSYIAMNLDSPVAAANFLDKVEECYDYLKHNPSIISPNMSPSFCNQFSCRK